MLDISQAGSQFLFQKHRFDYLFIKVTFLSMALEIFLFMPGSVCDLSFMFVLLHLQ